MIKYTDLTKNYEMFKEEYEAAALGVLRSGAYILGPKLKEFEEAFASYIGVKHCIGLNSGTDALILAVRALGIGPGDEVIVPAGTYIASVLGITENGATPVYIDSTSDTLVMDASKVEAAITDKTKAILPVHLYGQTCDMTTIMDIARRHDLPVIEDCAQCHGSTWNGTMAGSFGTMSCFSFYPTKPLGGLGDAGCICTDDDELADKIRMLRNYGSRVKYHNESIGRNSRLDDIQAAMLLVGLKHLDETNDLRVAIAGKYLNGIKNDKITLPVARKETRHVFHLFPVIVDDQKAFQDHMEKMGVGTQVHYPIPPFLAECYEGTIAGKGEEGKTSFANAYHIATHEVSLPIYHGMSDEDIEAVIEAVNKY